MDEIDEAMARAIAKSRFGGTECFDEPQEDKSLQDAADRLCNKCRKDAQAARKAYEEKMQGRIK